MNERIALQIAEPTGRYSRSLRRYKFNEQEDDHACPAHGYHDASVEIEESIEPGEAHGDNWPHEDGRWPKRCECGYVFKDGDRWQRNDDPIYRLPDGREFVWGSGVFGKSAPVGTMIRTPWFDDGFGNPGEAWIIALPEGYEWITNQNSTDGHPWTVTGTPPNITVSPSIFCSPPNGWHGFIRDGVLVNA